MRHKAKNPLRSITIAILIAFVLSQITYACDSLRPSASRPSTSKELETQLRNIPHQAVNDYIQANLPNDLREDKANISNYPSFEVADGITGRIVPIPGLLNERGQFAHIGLGRAYGIPVFYIDAEVNRNKEDAGAVIRHELSEGTQWYGKYLKLKSEGKVASLSDMRRWIKENLQEAKRLNQEFHSKAPSIAHLYDKYKAKINTSSIEAILAMDLPDDDITIAGFWDGLWNWLGITKENRVKWIVTVGMLGKGLWVSTFDELISELTQIIQSSPQLAQLALDTIAAQLGQGSYVASRYTHALEAIVKLSPSNIQLAIHAIAARLRQRGAFTYDLLNVLVAITKAAPDANYESSIDACAFQLGQGDTERRGDSTYNKIHVIEDTLTAIAKVAPNANYQGAINAIAARLERKDGNLYVIGIAHLARILAAIPNVTPLVIQQAVDAIVVQVKKANNESICNSDLIDIIDSLAVIAAAYPNANYQQAIRVMISCHREGASRPRYLEHNTFDDAEASKVTNALEVIASTSPENAQQIINATAAQLIRRDNSYYTSGDKTTTKRLSDVLVATAKVAPDADYGPIIKTIITTGFEINPERSWTDPTEDLMRDLVAIAESSTANAQRIRNAIVVELGKDSLRGPALARLGYALAKVTNACPKLDYQPALDAVTAQLRREDADGLGGLSAALIAIAKVAPNANYGPAINAIASQLGRGDIGWYAITKLSSALVTIPNVPPDVIQQAIDVITAKPELGRQEDNLRRIYDGIDAFSGLCDALYSIVKVAPNANYQQAREIIVTQLEQRNISDSPMEHLCRALILVAGRVPGTDYQRDLNAITLQLGREDISYFGSPGVDLCYALRAIIRVAPNVDYERTIEVITTQLRREEGAGDDDISVDKVAYLSSVLAAIPNVSPNAIEQARRAIGVAFYVRGVTSHDRERLDYASGNLTVREIFENNHARPKGVTEAPAALISKLGRVAQANPVIVWSLANNLSTLREEPVQRYVILFEEDPQRANPNIKPSAINARRIGDVEFRVLTKKEFAKFNTANPQEIIQRLNLPTGNTRFMLAPETAQRLGITASSPLAEIYSPELLCQIVESIVKILATPDANIIKQFEDLKREAEATLEFV